MAARSILYRILQAAEDERLIVANPVGKVPAPKLEVDPDELLGQGKRRALTPEEAGQLLARIPPIWWDHIVTLLGTGLRFGELGGLRRRRVLLDRDPPVIQVVATRYQAGKFGSGFKGQPKSQAGIRTIPLAHQVAEAVRRQLPPGVAHDDLAFADPVPGTGSGAALPLPVPARLPRRGEPSHRSHQRAFADHPADTAGTPRARTPDPGAAPAKLHRTGGQAAARDDPGGAVRVGIGRRGHGRR